MNNETEWGKIIIVIVVLLTVSYGCMSNSDRARDKHDAALYWDMAY